MKRQRRFDPGLSPSLWTTSEGDSGQRALPLANADATRRADPRLTLRTPSRTALAHGARPLLAERLKTCPYGQNLLDCGNSVLRGLVSFGEMRLRGMKSLQKHLFCSWLDRKGPPNHSEEQPASTALQKSDHSLTDPSLFQPLSSSKR